MFALLWLALRKVMLLIPYISLIISCVSYLSQPIEFYTYFLAAQKSNFGIYQIMIFLQDQDIQIIYVFIIITIVENLNDAGSSITSDMTEKIKDTCDIAYSFFRGDLLANAKYISDGLKVQGLPPNWDVIISSAGSDIPGFSIHSTNQQWCHLRVDKLQQTILTTWQGTLQLVVHSSAHQAGTRGSGINNQSRTVIQNIFLASFEQSCKTNSERTEYIQKRVQSFMGGKWSVFLTYNYILGVYVTVVDDAWLTFIARDPYDYWRVLLIYKVSSN